MWDQSVGIVAVAGYSFIATFVILKVLDFVWGIRVSEEEEELGLDVTQHGERAYAPEEGGAGLTPGSVLPAPPMSYSAAASPAPGHAG